MSLSYQTSALPSHFLSSILHFLEGWPQGEQTVVVSSSGNIGSQNKSYMRTKIDNRVLIS